jgi:serine-type D-Ala-D-Ala carboxypeptidase/endopeptidase (penicillin-binding protein 4)
VTNVTLPKYVLPETEVSNDVASNTRPFRLDDIAPPRAPMLLRALLIGAVAACLSESALADWKALAALERDGALVSASAIDLGHNTVIERLNADTRLTPASLTKLITAAAALEAWPTDKMFQTWLLTAGDIHDGVLAGDLILRGAGDPSLDDHSLWELAAQLKGYDISSVAGRLVVSLSPFGSIGCGTKDRCEAQRRSDMAYNAPIASIGVDFGNWCVIVRPTQAGREAQVRGCGVARLPLPVAGTVRTVPAGTRPTLWVERETNTEGDRLRVGGDIPTGSEQRVYRAMSDSARGVGLLLAETLRELGIAAPEPIIVTEDPPPANAYALAKTEGLTLREQLGRMLRFSNNYIADVLTMDLAASTTERPPPDLPSAAQVLTQFMSRVQRATQLSERQPPLIFSGSGITIENRLSASDLTALLVYQYRDTGHFPAFYGGLTVPRDAPFEFMRLGSDAWLDRVALKTGTLNEPVSVCGIAGYLRKRDGGWIAFAVIVNGGPGRKHIPNETAMRAAQSDLEDILARD